MLSAVSPVRSSVIATRDRQVSWAQRRIWLREMGVCEGRLFGTAVAGTVPMTAPPVRAAPPTSKWRRVSGFTARAPLLHQSGSGHSTGTTRWAQVATPAQPRKLGRPASCWWPSTGRSPGHRTRSDVPFMRAQPKGRRLVGIEPNGTPTGPATAALEDLPSQQPSAYTGMLKYQSGCCCRPRLFATTDLAARPELVDHMQVDRADIHRTPSAA
jgi:hypothetical protein